jgi:DNA-binding FrmR family transcriptional regulator
MGVWVAMSYLKEKTMDSYGRDKEDLLLRLRRIEGQVRGLQRMIEEEKYCIDILTQSSSVQAALQQVELILLENHMHHCVTSAIQQGEGAEKIKEMMGVVRRFRRI